MTTNSNRKIATKKAAKKSTVRKAVPKKPDPNSDICFVIMPFGGWLDDYYTSVYCPAISDAGLLPHRADDLFRPSTIVNDIWAYTKRAKVLLADLTGKNANVFYELGLAHALAKPVILVAESMEDIPFDLRALRIILYDKNAPDWGRILEEKIQKALTEVLLAPVEAVLPAFLDVKAAGNKPVVSAEQKDLIEIKQEMELLRRQLRIQNNIGSEENVSRLIGASDATELIRNLMREGASDEYILQYVASRGAPHNWIRNQIQRERLSTKLPDASISLSEAEAIRVQQLENLKKQVLARVKRSRLSSVSNIEKASTKAKTSSAKVASATKARASKSQVVAKKVRR